MVLQTLHLQASQAHSAQCVCVHTRPHTCRRARTHARTCYLRLGLSFTASHASVCSLFLSYRHTHIYANSHPCNAPLPAGILEGLKGHASSDRKLKIQTRREAFVLHVCVCIPPNVRTLSCLVIDYKRLFNSVSPHVEINLHSLSGVNGVSRWLARRIFEDCRLAGMCIQPPALFPLIDLLLPFVFSGCFCFGSFISPPFSFHIHPNILYEIAFCSSFDLQLKLVETGFVEVLKIMLNTLLCFPHDCSVMDLK